ncbi:MAG: hypothetical protein AB7P04_06220 [Bacteriovoracia bacterium]
MENSEMQKTPLPVDLLVPIYLALMAGLPTAATAAMFAAAPTVWGKVAAAFFAPAVFSIVLVTTAVILSLPFHAAIIPGRFPRNTKHVVYGPRRLYGLCWGAVFYCTPVYYLCMSFGPLKRFLLKGFGYRGSPDVNFAPDAWIRDLPVMKVGRGVYVANKSTVGTNMCLSDGTIMVDHVTLKDGAMIGHLSMIAPGCSIGAKAEVSVGCAIGIRAQFGDGARVGPMSLVNHGAIIGDNVDIGASAYIGVKTRIAPGLKIPGGANFPEGTEIATQADVENHLTSETQVMKNELRRMALVYSAGADPKATETHAG